MAIMANCVILSDTNCGETISIIPASKVAFAAGNSREDIIIFATAATEKMLEAALQQVYIPTKTKANLQSHTHGWRN